VEIEAARRRRATTFKLAALALGLLAAAGSCELLLRAIAPRSSYATWRARSLSFTLDEYTGWRLEPRRYSWGQVGRDFFRGPEVSVEKPQGVYRIVVLGGSAAFDLQKLDGTTWAARLERTLGTLAGARVQVINAATPGFSTWQCVPLLERRMLRYQPDLVLLYELYNDSLVFRFRDRQTIRDIWKLNARANYMTGAAHPSATWDFAGKLLPKTADFLRAGWIKWVRFEQRREMAERWWRSQLDAHATEEALGFYADNLERMAAVLQDRGVRFGIVTQASLIREQNPPEHRRLIQYEYRGMNHAALWDAYQRAWRLDKTVADRHPNTFVIPAHLMIPADLRYFDDEVHLSDAGSQMLASFIAYALRREVKPE